MFECQLVLINDLQLITRFYDVYSLMLLYWQ